MQKKTPLAEGEARKVLGRRALAGKTSRLHHMRRAINRAFARYGFAPLGPTDNHYIWNLVQKSQAMRLGPMGRKGEYLPVNHVGNAVLIHLLYP